MNGAKLHHLSKISAPIAIPFKLHPSAMATISSPRRGSKSAAITIAAPNLKPLTVDPSNSPFPSDSCSSSFWDYQMLFISQRCETQVPIPLIIVYGSIPADFPVGTYYLAGPGIFSDDSGSKIHPLDGHGYLRSFEFVDRRTVQYSARYVETAAKKEEDVDEVGQWRFTHRGPFSVLKGGKRVGNMKVMKNVANTAVLKWGGRLLCFWEGGNPYEMDGRTMGTIGAVDLTCSSDDELCRRSRRRHLGDVCLDLVSALIKPVLNGVFNMPKKRLMSHYKIDAKRNRLLLLYCNSEDFLLPRSNFTFYEFDSNFEVMEKKEFIIADQLMIHDWAFTENYYILIGNRVKLNLSGSVLAISGLSPMINALSLNPSKPTTPIYLLPRFENRANRHRDWRVPIEASSQLWITHFANAFEEDGGAVDPDGGAAHCDGGAGDGVRIQIQASACSYRWFSFQNMFGYNWKNRSLDPSFMNESEGNDAHLPHLVKVSIDMNSRGECRSCTVGNISSRGSFSADWPAINGSVAGQTNKFLYAGTTSGTRKFLPHFPYDTVVKVNCSDDTVTSWCTGKRKFIGEPIFVPRRSWVDEDDGYILVVEYAVSVLECYLVILDAKRIGKSNALLARLQIPKHLYFPLGFHGFWDTFVANSSSK